MQYVDIGAIYSIIFIFVVLEIVFISQGKKQIDSLKQRENKEKFYFWTKKERRYPSGMRAIDAVFVAVRGVILLFVFSILITELLYVLQIEANAKWEGFISTIPGIMITVLVTLITCLGIFAKWVKTEFIVYDFSEVFTRLSVMSKFKWMLGCAAIAILLQVVDCIVSMGGVNIISFSEVALVIDFVVFFINFFPLAYYFIDILIGYKTEKKILRLLYQNFWYESNKKIDVKEGNRNYRFQITFLLDEYITLAHSPKIKSIKNIKYDTNFKNGERHNRLIKRSVAKAFVYIIAWFILFGIGCRIMHLSGCVRIYVGVSLVFIVQFIVLGLINSCLSTSLILIVYGKCGYEITWGRKVRRHTYVIDKRRKNIFFRYINIVRSIMAYAVMAQDEHEIKEYIKKECNNRYSTEPAMELIITLLDYIFDGKLELQSSTICGHNSGMEAYANEFIKDCFYFHKDLESEPIQEEKILSKREASGKKNALWYGKVLIVALIIIIVVLIFICVFTKDIFWKELFMSLIGAVVGGVLTIIGVTLSLRVEHERQAELLRLDRMPLLAFRTYSTTLETLGDGQIFSIADEGICTSGFPDDPSKMYTGLCVYLANSNPAFNVHICNADIEDGFERMNYDANNPLEVRLVGNEQLEIMINYMSYYNALKNGCSSNISGVIQLAYEDIFGNQYIQDVPVIFMENGTSQKMEIRTLGQTKYIGKNNLECHDE